MKTVDVFRQSPRMPKPVAGAGRSTLTSSLLISALVHGMVLLWVIGGVWLFGQPPVQLKPSAQVVTLVDAPWTTGAEGEGGGGDEKAMSHDGRESGGASKPAGNKSPEQGSAPVLPMAKTGSAAPKAPPSVKPELAAPNTPAVARPEPVVPKTPPVAKPEPVAPKTPPVAKPEPDVVKTPLVAKPEPAAAKTPPVATKTEPVIPQKTPAVKPEPVVPKAVTPPKETKPVTTAKAPPTAEPESPTAPNEVRQTINKLRERQSSREMANNQTEQEQQNAKQSLAALRARHGKGDDNGTDGGASAGSSTVATSGSSAGVGNAAGSGTGKGSGSGSGSGTGNGTGSSIGSGGGSGGGLRGVRLNSYLARVRTTIHNAWQIPPGATANLQAVVSITIDKQGNVEQARIVQSSGNSMFDQSLLRAVRQVSPLPPLPEDHSAPVWTPAITFKKPS